jgi:hypothetical protein
MSLGLKLVLLPLLVAQARATRRGAPVLPEADGPREGRVGDGAAALRLLIAGVAHQDQALAGHLTRELHRHTSAAVHWSLHARSGYTTRRVHELLREAPLVSVDVAMIVTGVNDVIEQVPAQRALRQRAALADWLLGDGLAEHVVFAPLPPLHRFSILPEPLRRVVGEDARRHDEAIACWAATQSRVTHVPVDVELDPSALAADGFHPGEPVYRCCGSAFAAHIATRVWPTLQEKRR